jgi:flagellar biosynthetic protein FliS
MDRPARDYRRFGVVNHEIRRALLILAELKGSLDHKAGGEFARTMDGLYAYFSRRLRFALVHHDRAPLTEVHGLLQKIRDSWETMLRHPPAESSLVPKSA